MKTSLHRFFSVTTIALLFSAFVQAQPVAGSGGRSIQPDTSGEAKINQIANDAGIYFKQGLLSLQDNRRSNAREDFDKSVEVFLTSTINVKTNTKLNDCYNQLIETIYRMEFPSPQTPNVKGLANTCGWKVDEKLADDIAKLTQNSLQNPDSTNYGLVNSIAEKSSPDAQPSGFLTQEYLPKAGDELAAAPPELSQEDEQELVKNPEIQQQFVRVNQAIANKSFGFSFRLHPYVQQYIGYYRGRGRSTMETGLYRSGQFTRMARRIFREEGVPENIVWLGQVESAWKPVAKSWAAASGLWQFIPGTGSRYGLRINGYMDERNSFERATRASAQYLKFLANRYGGNWELGMAAYNCGEGNVDRAIRRAGVADFWEAYPYLPRETRNYVPNILAVILIANNPTAYGFGHVRPAPQLDYEILRVPPSTSLVTIAQLASTSIDYIRYLNPEFRTNMTPPEPYMVRVPTGRGNAIAAVLRKTNVVQPGTNIAVATVLKGETQQQLINRTSATQAVVGPNGKAVVQQGGNNVKRTVYSNPTSSPTSSPTGRGIQIIKAQPGDTLAKIAARIGVTPALLANLNGMTDVNATLQTGREIRVQTR